MFCYARYFLVVLPLTFLIYIYAVSNFLINIYILTFGKTQISTGTPNITMIFVSKHLVVSGHTVLALSALVQHKTGTLAKD